MEKKQFIGWISLILAFMFISGCKTKEKTLPEKLKEVNKKIYNDSMNIENYLARIKLLKEMHYSTKEIEPKGQLERDIHSILRIDPLNVQAYFELAELYRSNNEYLKAIHCYTKILDIGPSISTDSVYAFFHRGNLYEVLGFYREALNDYENSNAIVQNKINYHVIGRCNLFLSNYSEALSAFKQELKLCEYYRDTLNCLFYILHILSVERKEKEALQYLDNCKDSFYGYQEMLNYYRGVLYLRCLDTTSAWHSFNNVINQDKGKTYYANTFFYISLVYAIQGKRKESKEYLKKACELGFYDVDLLDDWKSNISNSLYGDLKTTASLNITEEARSNKQRAQKIVQRGNTGFFEKQRNYEIYEGRIPLIVLEPRKQKEYIIILKSIPNHL